MDKELETLESILDRRLGMFALDSLKSPIEVRLKSNKIGTGYLHSFNPEDLTFIIQGYTSSDEKNSEYKTIPFK